LCEKLPFVVTFEGLEEAGKGGDRIECGEV
jgi:hypothetical protein